jgi:hypothetical protein
MSQKTAQDRVLNVAIYTFKEAHFNKMGATFQNRKYTKGSPSIMIIF